MALDFDGSNDYINIPHNAALQLSDEITITAWVKSTDWTTTKWRNIISKGRSVDFQESNYELWLYNSNTTSMYIAFYYLNDAHVETRAGKTISIPTYMPLNTWTHIALVHKYTDSTALKIYFNGVDVAPTWNTPSDVKTPHTTTRAIAIGAGINWDGTAEEFWTGQIADVRIYNRILPLSEIQSNMHRYIVAETGLVGYWRLNEGTIDAAPAGNTAVDLSATADHGSDVGSMTNSDYVSEPPITPLMD